MIVSREAILEDLFLIELQPIQAQRDPRLVLDPPEEWQQHAARTIEKDGRPIACFGISPTLPESGEAWAFLSEEALALGRELTDEVFYWLDKTQSECKLRRVSAVAAEDHEAAHRWLLRLGFEYEGRMRAYGLYGETCLLYGRIR